MRKITTTIATLIALVGGAQASEPLIPFPNLKPHSTCIEIVSRVERVYPRWLANDGFSARMMLADDFEVWYHHGIAAVDWSNCNALAAGIIETDSERCMLARLATLTRGGMSAPEAADGVARELPSYSLLERPLIPKYDINPWTNRPHAQ